MLPLSLLILVAACNQPASQPENTQAADADSLKQPADTGTAASVGKPNITIPSPLQLASMIKRSAAPFNEHLLNPHAQASKYSSNLGQALNLGVYGADLAYTSVNNQTQLSIKYLSACKTLADQLGISSIFLSLSLINRFQQNLDKQDSLNTIISDLYSETENYLKENGRNSTSALILAGGWVEGIYMATELTKNKRNEKMMKRLYEQHLALNNLILLLSEYKSQNGFPELSDKLRAIYREFGVQPGVAPDTKVAPMLNETQLKSIAEKVKQLRDEIVNKG